jgi:hypothetical protein
MPGWNPFGPKLDPPAKVAETVMANLIRNGLPGHFHGNANDLRRIVEIVATVAQGKGVANGGAEVVRLLPPCPE